MRGRSTNDRRVKQVKVINDRRTNFRRQEDIANIKAYYFVLATGIITLVIAGILSFIMGRHI